MSEEPPRRPEREDLPGSESSSSSGGGWLPPSDAEPATDPFGRPWERREAPPEPPAAPASWPGSSSQPPPPPPAPTSWPAGRAPAPPGPHGLPQGVRPATYGARAQAAVVDFFVRLAFVLAGSLLGAVLFVAGETAGAAGLVVGLMLGFAAGLAYAPVMMTRTGGQTVGHKASGTRIVNRDGSGVTGAQATIREVAVKWLLIDAIGGLFVLPTLLNYLWPLWDDKNDALHDKLCRTHVVEA